MAVTALYREDLSRRPTGPATGDMEVPIMLHYALIFFAVAIVAAIFGFSGIAAGAAGIAKILFVLFLLGAVVAVVLGLVNRSGRV